VIRIHFKARQILFAGRDRSGRDAALGTIFDGKLSGLDRGGTGGPKDHQAAMSDPKNAKSSASVRGGELLTYPAQGRVDVHGRIGSTERNRQNRYVDWILGLSEAFRQEES
jgi:hypothetical protein